MVTIQLDREHVSAESGRLTNKGGEGASEILSGIPRRSQNFNAKLLRISMRQFTGEQNHRRRFGLYPINAALNA